MNTLLAKRLYPFVVGTVASLLFVACEGPSRPSMPSLLTVSQQTSEIVVEKRGQSDCKAVFTIDVPTDGPAALIDSVKVFLNHELYLICEQTVGFDFRHPVVKYKRVATRDSAQLLNKYVEAYRPHMQKRLNHTLDFSLTLVAQTASYVTYARQYAYADVEADCGTELYLYTFDLQGHPLKKVITHRHLVRFMSEHPEYCTTEQGWTFTPQYIAERTDFGLLANDLLFVITDYGPHAITTEIPFDAILPYLTPEAQTLVENRWGM